MHACLSFLLMWDREMLYRWKDNQSLCRSEEDKRPVTACNYSTHRKQLFAFPARTTHSALVAGARWRPLLWTVLVCSIFTLANYREGTSNTEPIEQLYGVIIDVSSEATLKLQWFKETWFRDTQRQWLQNRTRWTEGSSRLKNKFLESETSHFLWCFREKEKKQNWIWNYLENKYVKTQPSCDLTKQFWNYKRPKYERQNQ